MGAFFRKPVVIIGLAAAVILVAFFSTRGPKTPSYEIAAAKRGEVIHEVSVTGQVKSQKEIDLAFEKAGRIASINVSVGDKVYAGEILMQLANNDIAAQLDQAKADVKVQQAKLDELIKGTRLEKIQVQAAKVAAAAVDLENAKKDLVNKLNDAYIYSDDAVRNRIDQFFSNPRQPNAQLTLSLQDVQLKATLERERVAAETTLDNWKVSLNLLAASSDFESYLASAKNNLNQVKEILGNAAIAIVEAATTPTITQTFLDSWRAGISTGRANVETVIINLVTSENEWRAAQSALALAEQQLVLEKASSTPEQIAAQEAEVEQALANAENYQAQLSKTILRSPLDGIVTKQDANVGEIVAANTNLVSLISKDKFKIEANIPETDIAKVKIGDTAGITLDAYGNSVIFEATVTAIDPAETVIEGVSTYKTTFHFTKEDERIKPGMTANIDILTDKRENVIVIPQRAIIGKDSATIVKILEDDGVIKNIPVKIGLKGSDGNAEVIEGIKEGDKVTIWH